MFAVAIESNYGRCDGRSDAGCQGRAQGGFLCHQLSTPTSLGEAREAHRGASGTYERGASSGGAHALPELCGNVMTRLNDA